MQTTFYTLLLIFWLVFMGLMFKDTIKGWFFKPKFEITSLDVVKAEDSFRSPSLIVAGKNTTGYGAGYVRFEFKLYDKDGIVIGEKTVTLSNVYGYEEFKLKGEYLEEGTVEAKLMNTVVRNY